MYMIKIPTSVCRQNILLKSPFSCKTFKLQGSHYLDIFFETACGPARTKLGRHHRFAPLSLCILSSINSSVLSILCECWMKGLPVTSRDALLCDSRLSSDSLTVV